MASALAAEFLVNGAPALASYAASDLLERNGVATERSDAGFQEWQAFYLRMLDDLASALRMEAPELFAARIQWHRTAFQARDAEPELLHDAIASLFEVLREHLPPTAQTACEGLLRISLQALEEQDVPADPSFDPQSAHGRVISRYLDALFAGDRRAAIDIIEQSADEGMSIEDLYIDVLLPALVEVGRQWHLGQRTIAEEHFVTDTTRSAMAVLLRRAAIAPSNGKVAITASVQGNAHDLGVRVAADLFEIAGWRAICMGADVPSADLSRAVATFGADLVVLSVTIPQHLHAASNAIKSIRERSPDVRVLVGGQALADVPDVWRRLDADAYAPTIREAPALGLRLVTGA